MATWVYEVGSDTTATAKEEDDGLVVLTQRLIGEQARVLITIDELQMLISAYYNR